MKHLNLLVTVVACCFVSSCDYFQSDVTPTTTQAIFFTNKGGPNGRELDGTYIITGPHSYIEKTTDLLPSLPDGEYKVFFINGNVNGNISYFNGKQIKVGDTRFVVSSSDKARTILVPLKEITCYLSFKVDEGVKFSKVVLTNVPNSIYIDGELGQPETLTFYNDCYVLAQQLRVFVSIDVEDPDQPIKVLEGVIDAQPGHRYTLTLRRNGFDVSE